MTRPLHCSPFALLAATLGLLCACSGTETDNPVAGNDNPVIDGPSNEIGPPPAAPPCGPIDPSNSPNFPSGLAQTLLLPAPNSQVLATGWYGGLDLVDVSDPAHPTTLSKDVVPGAIQQLLLSASGKLWVAATEPPSFPDGGLPAQPELDAAVHIVELDVTDPRAPLVIAETQVDGTFWQMQERGDSIWALTARLVATQRDCSYVPGYCAGPIYEAVVLRGFHVDASALTPTAQAELPFDTRAFWRPDGVVTSLADGSLHLLTWDAQGSLRAPQELTLGDASHRSGPVDVVGNQLSVVDTSGDELTLRIYDLEAGLRAPQRSSDLGPRTMPLSEFSVFDAGKLWLSNGVGEDYDDDLDTPSDAADAEAQLWDVSSDTPRAIELPQAFSQLVPITGATLDTDPAALLAVGWQSDSSGAESQAIVTLSGSTVSVLTRIDNTLQLSADSTTTAPPGISGSGSSDSWQLVVRGAGLPLGVDPPAPPGPVKPWAFSGVPLSAASADGGAAIAEARLLPQDGGSRSLQLTTANSSVSFDVSPGANQLIALQNALIVVATTPVSLCEMEAIVHQSGADCSAYEPGIAVYDLSNQPRLTAELAFPALPVLDPNEPNNYEAVNWQFLGELAESPQIQPEGTSPLLFVADVDLTCESGEACAGLGIQAVPVSVPPEVSVPCGMGPMGSTCRTTGNGPPVTFMYGESRRQYFFRLALDSALAPSWQALGVSTLEVSSDRAPRTASFAKPIVGGDIVAATRLEPLSRSGEALPSDQARVMLDRFTWSSSGDEVAYPPVNVIGHPVARFPDSGKAQLWLSVDAPEPNAFGAAAPADDNGRVHLLYIDQHGAHDAQSLPLSGTFAGAVTLQSEDGTRIPIVLTTPPNSCGTSQLTAFGLDASGTLQSLSTLDLPEERWSIVAVDGPRVALQRGQVYALVELAAGALRLHSLRAAAGYRQYPQQLLGTTLFSIGGDAIRIDF